MTHRIDHLGRRARLRGPDECLDLGAALLHGRQLRRVGREEPHLDAGRLGLVGNVSDLLRVIEHDEAARFERIAGVLRVVGAEVVDDDDGVRR
jgi:hypothetical protein